jgi:Mg-chelatase subunit ChlD
MTDESVLMRFESAVKEACAHIESLWTRPIDSFECGEAYNACEPTRFPNQVCDPVYGQGAATCACQRGLSVSFDVEATLVAAAAQQANSDAVSQTNCRATGIGTKYREIADKHQLATLITGFQSGVHKSWPARSFATDNDTSGCRQAAACRDFDPRLRNWFVAASSGPKNVLLVLDTSGSMLEFGRLQLAQKAALSVIDTLSFADYVGVIRFSNAASVVGSCADEQVGGGSRPRPCSAETALQPATEAYKESLRAGVESLLASGATNYEAGLGLAFDALKAANRRGAGARCHTAVLFLTDGEVTEGRRGDELLEFIASINGPDDDVRIFTYALGDEASPSTLRQIACRNKGIFARVPDGGDLRAKMSQYYSYFAAGLVRRELVAWAEPFTECCGMGVVTTASQACYIPDTESGTPRLLAVAATSVPVSRISAPLLGKLLNRSRTCVPLSLTEDQINDLRGDE